MSLISESLRKAQLEAMRQDDVQRRSYFRSGRVDAPRARTGGAIALAALAGASAAGIIFFMFVREEVAAPAASARPQVVASAVPPVSETMAMPRVDADPFVTPGQTEPSAVPAAPPTPVAPATLVVTRSAGPKRKPEVSAAGRVSETREATPVVEEAPVTRKTTQVRQRDRFVDGKSYVSPIGAPGGMEIVLSGVSSIRGESVAIVNGAVVREGATVGPFVIEAIERGRVKMRYIDVRIWVTY